MHMQHPVLLLDKYDRGTKWGYAGFNGSILEKVVNFLAQSVKFQGGHTVNQLPRWSTFWLKGNVMIDVSFRREFGQKLIWKHINKFLEECPDSRVLFICGDGAF